jgi:hypothetical protein
VIALGFLIGAVVAAPVFFMIGLSAGVARAVSHEPADIRAALRRSR